MAVTAPSPALDARALNFLLVIEEVKAAFYARAAASGDLRPSLRHFARVAGGHERAHAAALRRRLGRAGRPAPKLAFGNATGPGRFGRVAVELEELALGAHSGQAPNLRPAALRLVLEIASVEGRHSAWIRDELGLPPAPAAADPPLTGREASQRLARLGFVR
jgi:hypothetical protein